VQSPWFAARANAIFGGAIRQHIAHRIRRGGAFTRVGVVTSPCIGNIINIECDIWCAARS
jgi:hypothetical protein